MHFSFHLVVRKSYFPIFLLGLLVAHGAAANETPSPDPEFDQILSLDISDLTVTSVSKHEQKLSDTAAAIYVVTQEDIRRAGVFNIPDALRLVPGIEVARVASNEWAVSSRGFNGTLSNKLLVMIDGRSIYTPVFSGVYWDDQSTLIEDIDRIEVIRGPGASLWGANAVDGIINVITKRADETQGNLVSALGTPTGGRLEGRQGGKVGETGYYRLYAQSTSAGATKDQSGSSNHDEWYRLRSGFRYDNKYSASDNLTVQGDVYGGEQKEENTIPTFTAPYSQIARSNDDSYGGNLLARWNHSISADSQASLQTYIDHYSRDELIAQQDVTTADIQGQHSVKLDDRNQFTWGGGVRLNMEELQGSPVISFNNENSTHHIFNLFLQDEYALVPNQVFLTLGSKFEQNDYTGFEFEPSGRIAWRATDTQTVWGAVSRAVRTPSSIEEDVQVVAGVLPGATPTELLLVGNSDQKSEEVIAYELGHRIQVTPKLSFDTALFYNDYSNLQTVGTAGSSFLSPDGSALIQPYQVNNLGEGSTYGTEIAANWNVTPDWRLSGSYSYLYMDLKVKPGTALTLDDTEKLAPRHQFSVRSYYNVTNDLHWDNMLYFVDDLRPPVDSYVRYDTRVAWLAMPGLELSVIGRNLSGSEHSEFPNTPLAEFGRSMIGQVLWQF